MLKRFVLLVLLILLVACSDSGAGGDTAVPQTANSPILYMFYTDN